MKFGISNVWGMSQKPVVPPTAAFPLIWLSMLLLKAAKFSRYFWKSVKTVNNSEESRLKDNRKTLQPSLIQKTLPPLQPELTDVVSKPSSKIYFKDYNLWSLIINLLRKKILKPVVLTSWPSSAKLHIADRRSEGKSTPGLMTIPRLPSITFLLLGLLIKIQIGNHI